MHRRGQRRERSEGAGGAMSVGDLSFSVCRTERWPEEISRRRHQPPLGHGQRLRTAPASPGVTGSGRRRRCRGDLTRTGRTSSTARAGPGSVSWAGHKGRSANIAVWDEPPPVFRRALGGLPHAKDTARIALGEVGIFPHPCGCGSGAQFPGDGGIRWDFASRGTSGSSVVAPSCPRRSRGLSPPALGRRKNSLAIPRGILLLLKGSE